MWRTAWVSLGLIGLAITTAFALTEGFEVWTAEGARRLAVIERPVPSPGDQLMIDAGLLGRIEGHSNRRYQIRFESFEDLLWVPFEFVEPDKTK